VTTCLDVTELPDRVVVVMNRPEVKNALNRQLIGELTEVVDELHAKPRILLITGGERGSFAAGADLAELLERDRDQTLAGPIAGVFDPLPTVAAIDGYALGGGAELALACDLRIGSSRMTIGFPEVHIGAIAGAGGCFRLRSHVGVSLAKQMLLTGRRLNAGECLDRDLVLRIVEPDELLVAAHALVDQLTAMAPAALRLTKAVTDIAAAEAHPLIDQLAQAVLVGDPERDSRIRTFLAR
jgi:enoyl-CoA hydratase/carnithine racemase